MKLSVIIPCYNEQKTIGEAITSVMGLASTTLEVEVIVVDDCSTDGSWERASKCAQGQAGVVVLRHDVNRGKGAALRTGFEVATGDWVGIHDADGEYDPHDYLKLLQPMCEGRADVVYGSRYLSSDERQVLRYWHSLVNKFLTLISNLATDMAVSDMETCYKLFSREVIKEIAPLLKENRFGFEPEITAHVARLFREGKIRVAECPIRYMPRSFSQGKKIGWRDGVRAVWCIFRYNIRPII